jgi:hypothetical protein
MAENRGKAPSTASNEHRTSGTDNTTVKQLMEKHLTKSSEHYLVETLSREINRLIATTDIPRGTLLVLPADVNQPRHSCRPNALLQDPKWIPTDDNSSSTATATVVRAIRQIGRGEEITISYIKSITQDYITRQTLIRHKFHFTCTCDHCSLPKTQREMSDRNLLKIRALDREMLSRCLNPVPRTANHDKATPSRRLHNVWKLLRLLRTEHICDMRVVRTWMMAMEIAAAQGDMARTAVLANEAWRTRVGIQGEEHPACLALRKLVDSPEGHALWAASGRKIDRSEPPMGLGENGSVRWLWNPTGWD